MSCQICKRGACARWMHSIEEQERFDDRETMSDDVDELRRTVQGLRDEIRELVAENITLRESIDDQADNEGWMREVLTDFRIPFDDHKIGRRFALTQWMSTHPTNIKK
mgnify:CR=1 FL=1